MSLPPRIRVCFVALNAYPAIDPRVPGGFGGIETRSWTFARALAQRQDFEVSFVVRHWHPLREKAYDRVRMHLIRDRFYPVRNSLLTRWKRVDRFPWLVSQQPHLRDLIDLPIVAGLRAIKGKVDAQQLSPELANVDADVYITFGVQSHSATVIATAKSMGRKSVLFLGSDNDLDERYLPGSNYTNVYRDQAEVCYSIIQEADAIFAQTEHQQKVLLERFGRESTVIRNPIDLTQWDELAKRQIPVEVTAGLERYALWVGRADPVHKQPQVLIEIARNAPEVQFLMLMNHRDDVCEAEIRRSAPENVRIVEHVPFAQMPGVYARAAVLVNTSSLEGFPNTFLQAGAMGIPIASLNVAEEFLRDANAGFYAEGDLPALTQYVMSVWSQPRQRTNASGFIKTRHGLQQQMMALAEAIQLSLSGTVD